MLWPEATPPHRWGQSARQLLGLQPFGMPTGSARTRALIATHIVRKNGGAVVRRQRRLRDGARSVFAEAVFFELALQNFGSSSIIRGAQGFFPHIFMPDYHGPHFDEALGRLALPHRGPNILYFSLTGACPCLCEYCFAGAGGADFSDVGDQAIIEVARKVAALRVPLVNISGGEPLSRYGRLLAAVQTLRSGSEVRLFTTGIGLTRDRLLELREAGLRGLFVSLDGADREAFDRSRGKAGAFDAATSALRLAAREEMLTFVNCVVGRDRFQHREDIQRFLRFVEGIDGRIVVNFLPQLATGRGIQADSFRHPMECEAVAERIVCTARAMKRPVSMLFGRVDRFIGCPGAGGKLMNVDVAGNVTVCISRATLGNILEEPFEEIYRRFVSHCHRLKVGFFCCRVGEAGGGQALGAEESARQLEAFYESTTDAEWQRMTQRFGWVFGQLFPEQPGGMR